MIFGFAVLMKTKSSNGVMLEKRMWRAFCVCVMRFAARFRTVVGEKMGVSGVRTASLWFWREQWWPLGHDRIDMVELVVCGGQMVGSGWSGVL